MKRLLVCILLVMLASGACAEETVKAQFDSMFVIASSGSYKYRDMVEPTTEDIAKLGIDVVPYLIDKLGTTVARERVTLENIFRKIGQPAVPLLNDALLDADSLQLSRIALILYYLPDTSSVDNLLKITNNDYYWARYQAVRALGKIGDLKAANAIKDALKDENELVRTMAAVSAGRMGAVNFLAELMAVLDDPYYGVRMTAYEALGGMDSDLKLKYLPSYLLLAKTDMEKINILSLMADSDCLFEVSMLSPYLISPNPVMQSLALRTAWRAKDKPAAKRLAALRPESLLLRQTIEELTADNEKTTPAKP